MLSTKRRPLNYVSMKTNRGRQPMIPKPVSDACYAPKYSLTDKAVLCKFSVNARAPCGVQWESLQRALSCRGLYVWN